MFLRSQGQNSASPVNATIHAEQLGQLALWRQPIAGLKLMRCDSVLHGIANPLVGPVALQPE